MDLFFQFFLAFFFIVIIGFILRWLFQPVTIHEYECGLLFKDGIYRRTLPPGRHRVFMVNQKVIKVDTRNRTVSLSGQELLTADNIGIRVSLGVVYKIADAHQSIVRSINFQEELYFLLQVQLRDLVGSLPVDEMLNQRKSIGNTIMENTRSLAADLGLELISVSIKDVMFPGELKNIFAQVVQARQEGLAALERARGESAAIRNLANTAKLIEDHPGLYQLRLIQMLEKGKGHSICLNTSPENKPVLVDSPKK